jgi:hypothetical protein
MRKAEAPPERWHRLRRERPDSPQQYLGPDNPELLFLVIKRFQDEPAFELESRHGTRRRTGSVRRLDMHTDVVHAAQIVSDHEAFYELCFGIHRAAPFGGVR